MPNTNNAPIRVDADPFVGAISREYQNSADITGRPITPTSGAKQALYQGAIDAEKQSVVVTSVYGASDNELNADGTRKPAGPRMGEPAKLRKNITVPAGTTAGTWPLTVDGATATGLAYNITAANLQAAINNLRTVEGATVTGGGTPGTPYVVDFPGYVDTVTSTGAALTPAGNISIT